MLPVKVRQFAVRALSAIFTLGVFILLLPITVGLTLVMLFGGLVTLATLRYQLRKKPADVAKPNCATERTQKTEKLSRPPIEGSYTVIE